MTGDENMFARGPRRHPSALGVRKQRPTRNVLAAQSVNVQHGGAGGASLKRAGRESSDAFLRQPLRPIAPHAGSIIPRASPKAVTRKASMVHERMRYAPGRCPVLFPRPTFPKNLDSVPVDLPVNDPPDLEEEEEEDFTPSADSMITRRLFAPEVYALAQSAAENCLDDLPTLPLT